MDLGGLPTINCGVPPQFVVGMYRDPEVPSANALFYDFFKLFRCFLLLTHRTNQSLWLQPRPVFGVLVWQY